MQALIVDDSRTMRTILGRMLIDFGFEVAEAADGREGLKRLGELQQIDLAIVDWNMPRMSGIEFLKAVRTDSTHRAVPLVMCTTETEVTQVAHALEMGASEYIMKPFTRDAIADKLSILGLLGHRPAANAAVTNGECSPRIES